MEPMSMQLVPEASDARVACVRVPHGYVLLNRDNGAWALYHDPPGPLEREACAATRFEILGKIPFGKPELINLSVFLTRRCNLACTYCYANADTAVHQGQDLDLERFRRAVGRLVETFRPKSLTFYFKGGEPLLRAAELEQFVSAGRALCAAAGVKPRCCLQTNATVLTEERLDLLQRLGVEFGVSFDGPPQIHDRHRPLRGGKPSFEAAWRGYELARQRGLTPGVVMVANDAAEFVALGDFILERGISPVQINIIRKSGRAADFWARAQIDAPELAAAAAAQVDFTRRILAHNQTHQDALIYDQGTTVRVLEMHGQRPVIAAADTLCCYGCTCDFAIDEAGDLFPCQFAIRDRGTLIATADELASTADFRRLWFDAPVTRAMREAQVARFPVCQDCVWRHFCRAGYLCSVREDNDGFAGPDPKCAYIQHLYAGLFDLELAQPGALRAILDTRERFFRPSPQRPLRH